MDTKKTITLEIEIPADIDIYELKHYLRVFTRELEPGSLREAEFRGIAGDTLRILSDSL